MKSAREGFTLIELLVVIAIIGLLATVVLAALGPQRKNARIAAMQASMKSLQTAMDLCMQDDVNLTAPAANVAVCASGSGSLTKYGTLPSTGSWTYSSADLTTSDGAYSVSAVAAAAGDNVTITCTQSGCTKTP